VFSLPWRWARARAVGPNSANGGPFGAAFNPA